MTLNDDDTISRDGKWKHKNIKRHVKKYVTPKHEYSYLDNRHRGLLLASGSAIRRFESLSIPATNAKYVVSWTRKSGLVIYTGFEPSERGLKGTMLFSWNRSGHRGPVAEHASSRCVRYGASSSVPFRPVVPVSRGVTAPIVEGKVFRRVVREAVRSYRQKRRDRTGC